MNTRCTAAAWIGFGALLMLSGGCQQHQQMIVDASEVISTSDDRETGRSTALAGQSWVDVLFELELMYASGRDEFTGSTGSSTMPQLVAGDWLAIECAVAGGYWDVTQDKSTPAYAEVLESWSIVE